MRIILNTALAMLIASSLFAQSLGNNPRECYEQLMNDKFLANTVSITTVSGAKFEGIEPYGLSNSSILGISLTDRGIGGEINVPYDSIDYINYYKRNKALTGIFVFMGLGIGTLAGIEIGKANTHESNKFMDNSGSFNQLAGGVIGAIVGSTIGAILSSYIKMKVTLKCT